MLSSIKLSCRPIRIVQRFLTREQLHSRLLRNASWLLGGQFAQLIGRLLYFVIIAHVLGPRDYGSFVACTALVGIVAPYASFGTGHIMIKHAARDRSNLSSYFGNALLVTSVAGASLLLLLLLLRSFLLPHSVTGFMLLAVAIADLICTEMMGICLQVLLVAERAKSYSQVLAISTVCRLIAAGFLAFSIHTAQWWAMLYAISSLVALGFALPAAIYSSDRLTLQIASIGRSVREGFHFATSLSSQSIYNDIDKTMLARLSTVEATAIYAVAYRFIEPSILPIRAAASASYPEFFRHGEGGIRSGFSFARTILPHSMLYGAASALLLYLAAGLIPVVLGAGYADSTVALRLLCPLPFLKSIHIFLSDTLTGCNYQWQTSSAQIIVALLNAIANIWLIRSFAWRGAAWSSLATDALLIVCLLAIIQHHMRQDRHRLVNVSV